MLVVEEMPVAEIAAPSGAAAAVLVPWISVGNVVHLVDVGLVLVRELVAQKAALPLAGALLVVAFAELALVAPGIQLL